MKTLTHAEAADMLVRASQRGQLRLLNDVRHPSGAIHMRWQVGGMRLDEVFPPNGAECTHNLDGAR